MNVADRCLESRAGVTLGFVLHDLLFRDAEDDPLGDLGQPLNVCPVGIERWRLLRGIGDRFLRHDHDQWLTVGMKQ